MPSIFKSLAIAALFASFAQCFPVPKNRTGLARRTLNTAVTGAFYVAENGAPDARNNDHNAGHIQYRQLHGDGSNWPSKDQWVSFDAMFAANVPIMRMSCSQWNVPNNSDEEICAIKSAIYSAAQATGVDKRFILSIIMQESNGCVRVPTTKWSVPNPGLMQDHDGKASCNTNNVVGGNIQNDGAVSIPCQQDSIAGMIFEGTNGTETGDGLSGCLNQAAIQGVRVATAFYRAARIYNTGSYQAGNDLGTPVAGTSCYSSDIANRLLGWVGGHGEGCSLPNPSGGVS